MLSLYLQPRSAGPPFFPESSALSVPATPLRSVPAASNSTFAPAAHPPLMERHRAVAQKGASVSPFLATLAASPQLTENPDTLSPVLATLTNRVKHKPFACHSYKKHRGVGHQVGQRRAPVVSRFFSGLATRHSSPRHYPLCNPHFRKSHP
jgi:hypothetical protein